MGFPVPEAFYKLVPRSVLYGWLAYAAIDPFDERRADMRHAKQSQILHTLLLGLSGNRGRKANDLIDYAIDLGTGPKKLKKQSPKQIKQIAWLWHQAIQGVQKK